MYELDPDVVRWGLHLIDVCSLTSKGSPQTVTCYEENSSRIDTVKEGFCTTTDSVVEENSSRTDTVKEGFCTTTDSVVEENSSRTDTAKEGFCTTTDSVVENDEVIALALQEELSRLASAEALGYVSSEEQHQEASILAQEWLGPSGRHFNAECLSSEKEAGKSEALLPELENLSFESEDQQFLPEIEHESVLDGELGKRLNQMIPVPHVPKINGEIPSVDEATSDHERLLNRLQLYELGELKISGDGNCQFRSLSDQIYRTPEHHKFVREQVVEQLKSRSDLYENYVPMAYADYLKKMSKDGEWGDHVTLQAAADWFGIKIFVITSFKDTCYIEILPHTQKSDRTIFLSFWAEVHYNSIYPLGELPVVETKKKKRWLW